MGIGIAEIVVWACVTFNGVPMQCAVAHTHAEFPMVNVQAQVCEMTARKIAISYAQNFGPMYQWARGRCIYS